MGFLLLAPSGQGEYIVSPIFPFVSRFVLSVGGMNSKKFFQLGWVSAGLAIVFTGATVAHATDVGVRVGQHGQHTRLVFDLEEMVGYRVDFEAAEEGEVLVVELAVPAGAHTSRFDAGYIRSIQLMPDSSGQGSVARVQLRGSSLQVSEMMLSGPTRLVFDVGQP